MGINATLIGQMITFGLLVLFTMKFVWPPVTKALQERQKKIADGLAAAERAERELELAQHKATDEMRDAKLQAAKIIEQADKRVATIIEEGKEQARREGDRLIEIARQEIEQERKNMRAELSQSVAGIALKGAEKIIGRQMDESANSDIIDQLVKEVAGE